MESRGSRQKEGCKTFAEGMRTRMEGSQQRSFSSSCMVFLMRRSIVVSHWSSREMVSYSFTCQHNRGDTSYGGGEVTGSVKYCKQYRVRLFLCKSTYMDWPHQWRRPRSAPRRHLEVSVVMWWREPIFTKSIHPSLLLYISYRGKHKAYLQQFAFSRVREGWKHFCILLLCKLLKRGVKVRRAASMNTDKSCVRVYFCVQHVDTEVTECCLEEVILGTVFEKSAVHGVGSNLQSQADTLQWTGEFRP